ncbi:MAG: LAGLIDADG family homing endonuclease [Candidatus Nealsonbacteria bacterium]
MNRISLKRVNKDFFKYWSEEMSYVLGYIVADGCVIKRKNRLNSYILNITSKDKKHLLEIKKILGFDYPISIKNNSKGMSCSQIQICNKEICKDLIDLGILSRKTYCLGSIKVPENYFSDFARGFFDGDGTVYIYQVNGTPQIKAGFVSSSYQFITEFNQQLCEKLNIPVKTIHKKISKKAKRIIQHDICFYINDCDKLAEFLYKNNPILFLSRKRKVFEKWKLIKRRDYEKQNYPSKVGWHLNKKVLA